MSDPVIVVPYDPEWPRLFAQIAAPMRAALGETALRIDHIGSTAVPGMVAKPIIDVQISVAALEPVDPFRDPLAELGYVFRADNPDRSKRYFREAPGTRRTHIHVRPAGSWPEQLALLFRDYLRAHPEAKGRYGRCKLLLSARHREDRNAYTAAKAPIIWEIVASADRWSQKVGWKPASSDV
jgi:GrpB-like predicted nucleotidyltransferase (UPF0157 family)